MASRSESGIDVHLDELLEQRGMTLTELADQVDITVVNLSVLKNGRARAIRFSTLAALCEALACHPGDLHDLRDLRAGGWQTRAMGKVLDALDQKLTDWIGQQHVFFVATAPSEGGRVNLSPKGHDCLRVVDPTTVAYLDLTGSGVETIAHTRENGRITVMCCAFEGPPLILRLFGVGEAHPVGSDRFGELQHHFPAIPGARSIITVAIERVQTSCGYSIPFMDYREERPTLQQWAERKGDDGLVEYWAEKNVESIDGLPALDH